MEPLRIGVGLRLVGHEGEGGGEGTQGPTPAGSHDAAHVSAKVASSGPAGRFQLMPPCASACCSDFGTVSGRGTRRSSFDRLLALVERFVALAVGCADDGVPSFGACVVGSLDDAFGNVRSTLASSSSSSGIGDDRADED